MYLVMNKCVTAAILSNFSRHYLRNRSTLDIGVLGYSPEVWHIPPGTPCIYGIYIYIYFYFGDPLQHIPSRRILNSPFTQYDAQLEWCAAASIIPPDIARGKDLLCFRSLYQAHSLTMSGCLSSTNGKAPISRGLEPR